MNTNQCLNGVDESYFINLSRRKDRLYNIQKNINFRINRFNAIDSKFLNDKKPLSKEEKACFLSHYNLWLIAYQENKTILILEDDVVFDLGFEDKWNCEYSNYLPSDYNIIYLGGCLERNLPLYRKVLKKYNKYFFNVKKNNFFHKKDYFWHMTSIAYILTPSGAKVLINEYKHNDMNLPVDHFIIKSINKNDPNGLFHHVLMPAQSQNFTSDIKLHH